MSEKPPKIEDQETPQKPKGVIGNVIHKAWWLHSFWALFFGIGVMLVAREGLAYADSLLIVLGASWLLIFFAFRFVVGPENRKDSENVGRKGVRLMTNYMIKNLYQQMFFFLVPMYAFSATWSLVSFNWIWAPVLLFCAVVSTMDLLFDNFIMERKALAASMYGIAFFCMLNLMLPIVFEFEHFFALMFAATITPLTVALLTFRLRNVFSSKGAIIIGTSTLATIALAWFGRIIFPPVPTSLSDIAVGHGTRGSYECLPSTKKEVPANALEFLRCGSTTSMLGDVENEIVHRWIFEQESLQIKSPENVIGCGSDLYVSYISTDELPEDPIGKWSCRVETKGGQLIGQTHFEIVAPTALVPLNSSAVAENDSEPTYVDAITSPTFVKP